jgi:hypothetical protein
MRGVKKRFDSGTAFPHRAQSAFRPFADILARPIGSSRIIRLSQINRHSCAIIKLLTTINLGGWSVENPVDLNFARQNGAALCGVCCNFCGSADDGHRRRSRRAPACFRPYVEVAIWAAIVAFIAWMLIPWLREAGAAQARPVTAASAMVRERWLLLLLPTLIFPDLHDVFTVAKTVSLCSRALDGTVSGPPPTHCCSTAIRGASPMR